MVWYFYCKERMRDEPVMAPKNSKEKLEKMRAAAVAAVYLRISEEKKVVVAAALGRSGTGRENWKMAGRAERLGIGRR